MENKKITLGYSCWGFLGNGIVDTPDGGRSHRLPFIKGLIKEDYKVIFLQKNRDLYETGQQINITNLSYHEGYPDIDVLFLEYRWKIPGRNFLQDKNDPHYTPDWDRQQDLINFYSGKVPILVWDKDQKLSHEHRSSFAVICEAALFPNKNRESLLFPIGDEWVVLEESLIKTYDKTTRTSPLVYIGNQYERDETFNEWIDKTSAYLNVKTPIWGNWKKYEKQYKANIIAFPHCDFQEKLPFEDLSVTYQQAFATVLIAPERYYNTGQFTQRLFEALCNLCIPLTPSLYRGAFDVIIPEFIIHSGRDAANKIQELRSLSNEKITDLFFRQLKKIEPFSLHKQVKRVKKMIDTMRS